MITIDNVINIDGFTEFAGSQQIDPAGIVYIRTNPEDTTTTLLYEEQLGAQELRIWTIDETVANVASNAVTDAGYECIVTKAGLKFMLEDITGTWGINPARIFQMRDNEANKAIIRLNSMNTQGLLEFVLNGTSASIFTTANNTITQVEVGEVSEINEAPLLATETIYWSTRLVEKVIPARTGAADYSTPEQVWVATFEAKTIIYTIDSGGSSS